LPAASFQVLYARPANAYGPLSPEALHCRQFDIAKEPFMDVTFLLLTFIFFLASVALVHGCERLRKPS
jgi:hypothetical protein